VAKVPLQHGATLTEQRDDYCGIFQSLALVNGRCVGWYPAYQAPKPLG
jgi:hypothetical protein